jgi:SAM-dependent methyltransferase
MAANIRDVPMQAAKIRLTLPPRGSLVPSSNSDPIDYYYKPIIGRVYVQRINTVLGLLSPGPHGTILELGYGSGILIPSLVTHADRYIGVDIAPPSRSLHSWLDRLEIDRGKVQLLHGDISTVVTPAVDLVVAISIFEHVHDLDGILSTVRMRLKPGGLLLVGMPRVDRIMTFLIEHGLRYKGIDDHHVSTFGMFLDVAKRYFRVLRTARVPAWLPHFAAVYHAVLLRTN